MIFDNLPKGAGPRDAEMKGGALAAGYWTLAEQFA